MNHTIFNLFNKYSSIINSIRGNYLGKSISLSNKTKQLKEDYGFDTAFLSDIGCVRKRNEDSASITFLHSPRYTAPCVLALVADGMGGHKAGNHASQLAVQIIREVIETASNPSESNLEQAFLEANKAIFKVASENADYAGMGTTATALLIVEGNGWMAHVGDSRMYRLRNKQLSQLSQDHTLVANMVRNGIITGEQAKVHPDRNVLDRAMGTHQRLEIMHMPIDVALGDIFMLCSDGLHDLVSHEEIQESLINYSPQASCSFLVDLARRRGGYDNISVVSMYCDKPSKLSPIPSTRDTITINNV